jgi:hypothetical protein
VISPAGGIPAARRVSKQAALFCKKARKKLH